MTDLFDTNGNPPTPGKETTTPPVNDYSAYLSLIKNESGEQKYASIEKALEALAHTQSYIPHVKNENETLKRDLEELKSKVKSQESIEEALARLAAAKSNTEGNPPAVNGLDEAQVANLFQQFSEKKEAERKASENLETVTKALTDKYGEKAKEAIQAKAQELGLPLDHFKQWASTAPKAVLQLFNAGAPKGASPTHTSVTTPLAPLPDEEVKYPERSLLYGATTAETTEFMRKIRAATNKRYGIQE